MEDKKVLPASAGMILPPVSSTHRRSCAPRIRGDDPPPLSVMMLSSFMVLPASAGMIPTEDIKQCLSNCAPRIRGDDPG